MKMKVIHTTSVTLVFEIIVMFIQFFFVEKMDESLKQRKKLLLNQNTKWTHSPAPEPSNFKKYIPLVIRDTNQPCAPRSSSVLRTAHSCSNLQMAPDLSQKPWAHTVTWLLAASHSWRPRLGLFPCAWQNATNATETVRGTTETMHVRAAETTGGCGGWLTGACDRWT